MGLRRVVPRDVQLTDGLPEHALDQRDPALPALAHLRRPGQPGAVEGEVLLHQRLRQVGRERGHHAPAQPGPPRLQRLGGQRLREAAQGVGLADDDLGPAGPGQPDAVGPRARDPAAGRRARAPRRQVVRPHRVAGGHGVPVRRGQARLQGEHRGRGPVGLLGGGDAGEHQHAGHVGGQRLPHLGVLLLAVVRLVRQAQPALAHVEQVAGGVALVDPDVGAERAADALALQRAEQGQQLLDRGHRVHAGHDLRERGRAQRVHAPGVHEAGVQVADLALDRPGLRLRGRGLLDDRAHVLLGLLAQHVERAVGGPVGRDLGGGEPAAVDVAEEVVLGPDRGVGVLQGRGGRCLRRHRTIVPHPPDTSCSGRRRRS